MADTYTPRPGSIAWRVIDFLTRNPDEELTRGDIATKFDCVGSSLDSLLSTAVRCGALKRIRNTHNELVWIVADATKLDLQAWEQGETAVRQGLHGIERKA